MKKALFFAAAALFVAGMTVSCGNKNVEEEVIDTIDTTVVEEVVEEATEATAEVAEAAEATVDNAAMLAAAKEAGQAKCNCYKTDAASVEACIKSIISAKYAQYEGNTEFAKAMEAEYKACITAKAKAVATEAANQGIKEGAKALSNALNKKN